MSAARRISRWLPLPLLLVAIVTPRIGLAAAPSVASITFAPATITLGGTSRLTITLGNPNAAVATLTGALTDTLPAGLTVAAVGGGSCPVAGVGSRGGSTISYPAGAAIPAGGCSISATVQASGSPTRTFYTDTIAAGALATDAGVNAAAISSNLTLQAGLTVPNLTGLSQTQVANSLQALGLVLGTVGHAPGPANIPFGAVISQTPAATSAAAPGTVVAVVLSSGPGRATNLTAPLTSVPGFVEPSQLSIASALERVCAALQTPGATLSAGQRNLLANCLSIEGTYGGGANGAGLKSALDAVSGKTATAQQTAGIRFAGAQFQNIGTRLAQLRQGMSGASFADLDLGVPMLGTAGSLVALLKDVTGIEGLNRADGSDGVGGGGGAGDSNGGMPLSSRLGFFVNGSLRRGEQDTTDLETGFDFRQNTITTGLDYRITNWWVVGMAYGHASGNTEFAEGVGRLDSRNNSGSIYTTLYNHNLYVDLIGTFAHVSYDAARSSVFSIDANSTNIPSNCAGSSCTIDTVGSTGARQLSFALNVGYGLHIGGLEFGPDVALNYTGLHVNAFTEGDPNTTGLALAYDAETGTSLLLKAGGSASYAIGTPIGVILPHVRAHYVHEFQNDQRTLSAHFIDDPTIDSASGPTSNFVVFTDQPTRNYFDWAGGVSMQFRYGISAFVDYSSTAAEDEIHTQDLTFGLRFQYAP
jgi:outer membrane lipase/esterase